MSLVKTLFCKFGQLLLSIVRSLRKAICCRRKKEQEYLLPMTVGQIIGADQNREPNYGNAEYKSQWDAWPEAEPSIINNRDLQTSSESEVQDTISEHTQEDFFKDMVPQIRRPKKLYIPKDDKDLEKEKKISNRLAMDPKAILLGPDLGIMEENSSTWEESESLSAWDADLLIQEKKKDQQEKRRADHQRRKMEKESRKSSGPETLTNMLNLDSKDKNKYS
ncbi:hypothetical protein JTE90_028950 [Oedothorax gibbosus]|uniref:Receptor-binding cancer antigen expressed on SiSo cells n=1 Tax=Oedothorax gibbosus TaxID=931172 RepID=A0AAV6VJZ7_9ARAC|nr:hypothetical protein JTE90_028950 [Oedothorax gibbosus]